MVYYSKIPVLKSYYFGTIFHFFPERDLDPPTHLHRHLVFLEFFNFAKLLTKHVLESLFGRTANLKLSPEYVLTLSFQENVLFASKGPFLLRFDISLDSSIPPTSATHPEVKLKAHPLQLVGDKRGISGRLSTGIDYRMLYQLPSSAS